MADQSYAEFINAFAKANVPLKKHTKGIQLMAIKYKLLEKAFGPFLDIFLSVKQVGQVVGESFEALNKPTEELTENMENLDSVLGGVWRRLQNDYDIVNSHGRHCHGYCRGHILDGWFVW